MLDLYAYAAWRFNIWLYGVIKECALAMRCCLHLQNWAIGGLKLGIWQDFKDELLFRETAPPANLLALTLGSGASAALYGALRLTGFDFDRAPIAGL
jgi:hypothetical protein